MTTHLPYKNLAAVVLTKNAEDKIENCLKSIHGWADEIIIVDGESTDNTLSICKKYTSQIFSRPFKNFSDDRNFGATQAKSEWILQLDADEIVPSFFKNKFETIRNTPSSAAYKTRRKNFFLGHCMKNGPWYHYIHILYLKELAYFYGLVHERLKVNGSIGTLEADVEHYPFNTISEFISRQNRYTTLAAQELFETQGLLPWKKVRKNLFYKPLKLFWKLAIVKKGYRDGTLGIIFSMLYAFEHFLKWTKYWELACHKNKPN
ncbi:MAG: glycosyltransferase family 2 protein [Deltaproteobacteria bacterium]|nr:glycosyltransferase family 2 protein [Deltaproteobacteria bacterium]